MQSTKHLKALIYKGLKRILQISICAILLLTAPFYTQNTHAQSEDFPNEFIFQVLLKPDWRISEAIFTYERDGKYYLPLGELARGFEFFVDVEPTELYATGFASQESNSFTIDGGRHQIVVKGEQRELSKDAILQSDFLATDDLYVQLEILNEIWPTEMRIELSELTILAETEEELSFMRNKARAEKRLTIENRKNERDKVRVPLPTRDNDYQLLGKPVIDYQAIYQFETEEDELRGSNIFTGVQQFGNLLADFSTNFRLLPGEKTLERPDNVRLKLSRKSAGEEYLPIPGVRNIEVGDVNLQQRDLISNSESGRGIVISNDNRERNDEFDRITIDGVGPPGWEIELYNNEELINFSVVPDDGEYFFEDVVLNFGNNQIKLLFFGPQGQVREEFRSYNAGGNMLSPGDFKYRAGFLDTDRSFILLDNDPRTQPRGVTRNLSASYGVNNWLTVFGHYADMPQSDTDRKYLTAGAAVSTPIGLFEAEAYNELQDGHAFSLNYITSFLGFRTNFKSAIFNNFESTDTGLASNRKTSENELQINRTFKVFGAPIGLRINGIHTERQSGARSTNINTAQTFSHSGVRLTHNTSTRLANSLHEQTTGSLTTTIREGNWQLRGGLNYEAYPTEELSSANAELRYKTGDGLQVALNGNHNFVTSDYRVGVQGGYDFKKFLGTLETDYERDMGWTFVLRMTTSLHPYTDDNGYNINSSSRRNYAPIKAHIFLDKNADGIFNEDDEPLPEARIEVGGGRSSTSTNEDGYLITNAQPDRRSNIRLDSRSLVDPYYISGSQGFSTIPLKGKMIEAAFPVVETGAIEGSVYRRSNDRAVPGLTINLLDTDGKTIQTAETAFDGYYTFEFVPPGEYTVEADESHNIELLNNRTAITPDELFNYGYDLYINDYYNLDDSQKDSAYIELESQDASETENLTDEEFEAAFDNALPAEGDIVIQNAQDELTME